MYHEVMDINSDVARGATWTRTVALVCVFIGCTVLLVMVAVIGWNWISAICAPISILTGASYLRTTRRTT